MMGKWKFLAGVVAVFLLGASVGSLGTVGYLRARHPFMAKPPGEMGGGDRAEMMLDMLSRKLDLTGEQVERIRPIVVRQEAGARQRFLEHRKEMKAWFDKGFAEMSIELTPDQKTRLEEMRRDFERRMPGPRPPGEGPGPGHGHPPPPDLDGHAPQGFPPPR